MRPGLRFLSCPVGEKTGDDEVGFCRSCDFRSRRPKDSCTLGVRAELYGILLECLKTSFDLGENFVNKQKNILDICVPVHEDRRLAKLIR